MAKKRSDPAEVVIFPGKHRAQVASELRRIADEIDRGEYGDVGCMGLVIMADKLTVHGAGPDSTGPSVATVLYAGFMKLIGGLVEHGEK